MQILRQNSERIQIDAVSVFTQQTKPHRFENSQKHVDLKPVPKVEPFQNDTLLSVV